jgi:hypothetical protein
MPSCWGEISQSLLHVRERLPNRTATIVLRGAFGSKHSKRAPEIAGILVEENGL